MGIKRVRTLTSKPPVELRQMTFGSFIDPKGAKPGVVSGKLGIYQWQFVFTATPPTDYVHRDEYEWEFRFTVTHRGATVYQASRTRDYIPQDVLNHRYVREMCEYLAEEFIEDGPSS